MDILLPSGVTLKDVPDGLTDDQIRTGAIEQGLATEQDFATQIDRNKVMDDWNTFSTEVTEMPTDEKRQEASRGKVASLFASGGAQFENVQNNIEEYSKQYIGDEKATPESVHGLFNSKVMTVREMSETDDIVNSIIDDISESTGIDYEYAKMPEDERVGLEMIEYPPMNITDSLGNVLFSLPKEARFKEVVFHEQFAKAEQEYVFKSNAEKDRIFQEQFVDQTPGGRFILSFGEQIIPEWLMPEIARTQADSPSDLTQELSGSITGIIGSFFLTGKAFSTVTGGAGVRVAPGVNNMLNKVALKSPRSSRIIEQSLNSFAIFSSRNQIHMDGNLEERVQTVGEDAIMSIAFPVANQISLLPKVGKPLGVATVGAVGASGKDKDPTERAIGATTMAMVYLLGRGVEYGRAKRDVTEFVKASGIEANVLKPNGKDAKWFVDGFDRNSIRRAADNIYNISQRNRAINDMAQMAMVKSSRGQRPSSGEKLALAKANENAVVGAPISGDRAVQQFNTTKNIVGNQEVAPVTEPTTPAEPEIDRPDSTGKESLQVERSMVEDIDDFDIPPEQSIANMGRIPAQPFEQEMHYNDMLPAIIPPNGPTNQVMDRLIRT
jgi:hypothetical protein